ncbi:MAG: RidA family protein [Pseudomonadota bacterium]
MTKSDRRMISTGSPFEEIMGYSRAVVQGDWCFISGVTGYDYDTMRLPNHISEQAENCFRTISSVLRQAGFSISDIVRVQYTVTDRSLVSDLSGTLEKWLGGVRPAATMVIADLIEEVMLIEIEVTAFKG